MKKRARKTLSRTDWLDAALRALEKGGVEAVKVLPLASALGTSRGSFYWHFRDRDDLLQSVLAHWEETLTEAVIARARELDDTPQNRFLALLEEVVVRRRGRYDPAVRAWALYDPDAARVVRRVDRTRITFITSLFRDMGFPQSASETRARVAYSYMLGDHQVLYKEPSAKRRNYLRARHKILTS